MRCPDCNKFVSFEEADPEVDCLDIRGDGAVTATVRIINTCAECSQELTEATFDLESDAACEAVEAHKCTTSPQPEQRSFEAEEYECERTGRSGYYKKGKWVPGFGRYAKTFYGAQLTVTVKCSACQEVVGEPVVLTDDVQASAMDSLV